MGVAVGVWVGVAVAVGVAVGVWVGVAVAVGVAVGVWVGVAVAVGVGILLLDELELLITSQLSQSKQGMFISLI